MRPNSIKPNFKKPNDEKAESLEFRNPRGEEAQKPKSLEKDASHGHRLPIYKSNVYLRDFREFLQIYGIYMDWRKVSRIFEDLREFVRINGISMDFW